ncbi:fumarylacetoacetate hydrolase family protein [Haliangium ochraceum]|uniref:Fumarylacetoacetate (FAA) hydrolase n=1 Tax=Haliangium ochraceum (strain DSM 14365 / JCM 11303 / SMP-2) TaxID=502025 RepID=D0LRN1_HALO1|nr:fumarylacetoacetate hydrolase family protein [Haliangium ochraceum]ACY19023.1 fumarylacetoacetate (FAA) hydrolase [Haliangium ochraceum DSM 14365]
MKLATLRDGTRDGSLVVVSRDNARYASARDIAPTMQAALDDWDALAPKLIELYERLCGGELKGEPVDTSKLHAPLPRAYEWVDGSAYINHIILVRKARNAEPPATLETDPLVYQGGSGVLLGPTDDIPLIDPGYGLDFEAEICAVLGDTPQGTGQDQAGAHIRLLMLCNDITLRNLIPPELAKGFGFFVSKPASAFSPFAVTPDELGDAFQGGRVHLPLSSTLNGERVGNPDAGPEMHFSFFDLVAHITRTRAFTAGTILGSGTVSNSDRSKGISCLAERRMIEIIDDGAAKTEFLKTGDRVAIEMFDGAGASIFGRIEQQVVAR